MRTRGAGPAPVPRSAFAGFRFPPDVIVLAVRWYLRFGLSYRDVEDSSPSTVSRLTTSPSTGGCSGSRAWSPRLPTYPTALGELLPATWHRTDRYPNKHIEADHGRLKSRLGPMRGLKQDRSAKVVNRRPCLRPEPAAWPLRAVLGDLTPDHVAASACREPTDATPPLSIAWVVASSMDRLLRRWSCGSASLQGRRGWQGAVQDGAEGAVDQHSDTTS